MTYYCEHYISPMEMNMPESTDTVHINRSLNLNQVAEVCKVDIDQLRALNPEFKRYYPWKRKAIRTTIAYSNNELLH